MTYSEKFVVLRSILPECLAESGYFVVPIYVILYFIHFRGYLYNLTRIIKSKVLIISSNLNSSVWSVGRRKLDQKNFQYAQLFDGLGLDKIIARLSPSVWLILKKCKIIDV